MPNFADNYTMHVLYNESPCIDVIDSSDGQSTNPGGTVHILFTYRGGVGTGRASSFKIFLYDRSDVPTDGTPDAPEPNLPMVFSIMPTVPLRGRPNLSIPQTDTLNAGGFISGIHAELVMGKWEAFWTGSFKITAPVAGSGEGEITEDRTTFSGQAQIVVA